MKYFTIDSENNITAHASRQAARDTGAGIFASEIQFADLIGNDNKRLIEIWNSLPGVTPVRKFTNRQIATERIWKAIQNLEGAATTQEPVTGPETSAAQPIAQDPQLEPASESATPASSETSIPAAEQSDPEPVAADQAQEPNAAPAEAIRQTTPFDDAPVANVGAQAADVGPIEPAPAKKATRKKKTPVATTSAKYPREGSKTSRVISMLRRNGGATLEQIMTEMGWQEHTTRALMSAGGSLAKKHALTVTSEKVGDQRTYFIKA
jgi:Protein of unknown function (DUF3489)